MILDPHNDKIKNADGQWMLSNGHKSEELGAGQWKMTKVKRGDIELHYVRDLSRPDAKGFYAEEFLKSASEDLRAAFP